MTTGKCAAVRVETGKKGLCALPFAATSSAGTISDELAVPLRPAGGGALIEVPVAMTAITTTLVRASDGVWRFVADQAPVCGGSAAVVMAVSATATKITPAHDPV